MPDDPAVDPHGFMDDQLLRQMLGMHFEERDLDLGLAPAAVELQPQRIDAAAIDHHQIGGTAVADVAATAFRLDKHVVPGCLSQSVDRVVRHGNKKGTFSLIVKTVCGIF